MTVKGVGGNVSAGVIGGLEYVPDFDATFRGTGDFGGGI